jgi:putative transposase
VNLVGNTGAVEFRGIRFGIGRATAGHRVCVMDAGKTVMIFDLQGTLIIEHPWPKPGTKYVSNGRPRGRARQTL